MNRAKRIKVALLRCDGHAFTFGPFMTKVDPVVFGRNYHAEYHFMIDAYSPDKLNTPLVSGIEVAKVWDADPARAERFQGARPWDLKKCAGWILVYESFPFPVPSTQYPSRELPPKPESDSIPRRVQLVQLPLCFDCPLNFLQ